jgi:lipopolysaccharide assembly protein A
MIHQNPDSSGHAKGATMRLVYCCILLILLTAVLVFAVQNNQAVTLRYLDRNFSCSLALLIAVVYLLGMVSGWTVVGYLKRSLQRVTEHPND